MSTSELLDYMPDLAPRTSTRSVAVPQDAYDRLQAIQSDMMRADGRRYPLSKIIVALIEFHDSEDDGSE